MGQGTRDHASEMEKGCMSRILERPLQGRVNRWIGTQGFTLGCWNAPFRLGDRGRGRGQTLALWPVDSGQWSVSIGAIVSGRMGRDRLWRSKRYE